MSVERILKALAVTDQGLSDTEKATARENIGAQGALTAGPNIDIYNDVISTEKPRVEAGTNVSVNSVLDPQTRVITYTVSATDTTYGVFNTTTDGLVPKASGTGDTGKFLKGDGTWEAVSTTVNASAPLYGTGTAADPLALRVSHGLSLVTPSGGQTYLQVTHPVPAPGSTSAGKVLTCDDALENLSWQDAPGAKFSRVGVVSLNDSGTLRVSLSNQSSASVLASAQLEDSITLRAGKRYLILPYDFAGDAFYTKTIDEGSNKRWQLAAGMLTGSVSMTDNLQLGCAQFNIFNYVADGNIDVPAIGGQMRASFSPFSRVIEPAADVTYTHFAFWCVGGVVGVDSSHPSPMYVGYRARTSFVVYEL